MAGGKTPPQSLIEEPELSTDLQFFWDAFWRLSTDRPVGAVGTGPIPDRSVQDRADRLGMSEDEAEWFTALIVAMDGLYLAWVGEQKPKNAV